MKARQPTGSSFSIFPSGSPGGLVILSQLLPFPSLYVAKCLEALWLNDPSFRHVLIYNFIAICLPALAMDLGSPCLKLLSLTAKGTVCIKGP